MILLFLMCKISPLFHCEWFFLFGLISGKSSFYRDFVSHPRSFQIGWAGTQTEDNTKLVAGLGRAGLSGNCVVQVGLVQGH